MNLYTAKVVDNSGKKHVITEEAISIQLFEEALNSRGFFIIKIEEAKTQKELFTSNRINKKFLVDFSYQVFSLLDFGIDINEVFRILSEIYDNSVEQEFIQEIVSFLKKGGKLSEAIKNSKSAEIFDDFFISMVSAGEQSGNLKNAFQLIHSYLENQQQMKQKLITAAVYPSFLLLIALVTLNMLLLFIIPSVSNFYKQIDIEPSLFLGILFNISDVVSSNKFLYFIVFGGSILGIIFFFRTNYSKLLLNFLMPRLPIVSQVFRLNNKIKIAFSLEILLKGGSSLEESLTRMAGMEKEVKLKKNLLKSVQTLKEGGTVKKAFELLNIFDAKDLNIIEISDSISKTPDGFHNIYNDTKIRLESYLGILFELLTPVVLILMGAFMLLVLYIVMSPNLELMKKL